MLSKADIDSRIHTKLITVAQRLGPIYAVKDFGIGGRSGSYNLVLVSTAVFVMCACLGKLNMLLAAFVGSSVIAALLLDREDMTRKLDVAALPAQLVSYLHLVLLWLRDVGPGILLCFLCYSAIEPYFKKFCLWGGNSFWVLYGAYAVLRTVILVKYLLFIWLRWDDVRPPFEIRRMNMRTRGEAARHMLWSFFMGNAGLVVRCGQQVATIMVFDNLQVLLGMDNLNPGPFAATVGIVGLGILSYVSVGRACPTYYKIHRTLHENKTLYTAIHRIHHKGIHPTVLDSGTETPLEFVLTESLAYTQCLWPDWIHVLMQAIPFNSQYRGHHSSVSPEARLNFHVDHHRLFMYNFGCTGSYPHDIDGAFGTLFAGRYDERPASASTAEPVK
jgi:sterol desaturase/sphingolipid hydroxylase (fatty acid hydroxylase superfamily)